MGLVPFLFNGASGEFISYLTRQHFNPALLGSTNNVWELATRDYLDEFEDGKSGRALFSINTAQYAVELCVETTVPESEQEAAQQGNGYADEGKKYSSH